MATKPPLSGLITRLVCVGFVLSSGAAVSFPSPDPGPPDLRTRLAARGLTFGFTYIGEVFSDVAGGWHRRAAYLDNISLTLTFDLNKIMGWRGASLYVYGMSLHGRSPSRNLGDAQGASNIAAFPTSRLYEAWVQQDLFDDRLSLLAGIYDLNSEFAVIEAGGVFLNSSQAIDPVFAHSGENGPSIFPYTTLGFRARYTPDRRFYFQAVVLNGVAGDPDHPSGTRILFRAANGVLVTAEAGWVFWSEGRAPLRLHRRRSARLYEKPAHSGKLALGVWTYTSRFDAILGKPAAEAPAGIAGNHGLYVLFSQIVLADNNDPQRHMAVFARLAVANPRINRFSAYAGAGLVFAGLFPGREQDVAGLAVAGVQNGDDYMKSRRLSGTRPERMEWNIELTYQAQITSWLSLHPDIQYVIHPDTNPAVRNPLGIDLRLNITL